MLFRWPGSGLPLILILAFDAQRRPRPAVGFLLVCQHAAGGFSRASGLAFDVARQGGAACSGEPCGYALEGLQRQLRGEACMAYPIALDGLEIRARRFSA